MPEPAQWRFAVSSTMRGIYVIRWVLFAGGVAIAFALGERAALHVERPLLGLGVGFAVGLALFRGQLRPLRWPSLMLSRDCVHLIQRGRLITLPWADLAKVDVGEGFVTLELRQPMLAPDGLPTEAIKLEARKFGTSTAELHRQLARLAAEPSAREQLPAEARVLALLTPPPPDGR